MAAEQTCTQLQLYDDPHSLYCAKVKVVLRAKGLDWQSLEVPCGRTSSPQFMHISSLGKIPALIVTCHSPKAEGHEVVIVESEVINEFLQECFPEPSLLPIADPVLRAQARMIARFHDLYAEPCLRKLYPQVNPRLRDATTVTAAVTEFHERMSQLQELLNPGTAYAVADTLTLADCAYPALFLYANLILPTLGHEVNWSTWPRLQAWQQTLATNPHVALVMAELQPAAEEWLRRKLSAA